MKKQILLLVSILGLSLHTYAEKCTPSNLEGTWTGKRTQFDPNDVVCGPTTFYFSEEYTIKNLDNGQITGTGVIRSTQQNNGTREECRGEFVRTIHKMELDGGVLTTYDNTLFGGREVYVNCSVSSDGSTLSFGNNHYPQNSLKKVGSSKPNDPVEPPKQNPIVPTYPTDFATNPTKPGNCTNANLNGEWSRSWYQNIKTKCGSTQISAYARFTFDGLAWEPKGSGMYQATPTSHDDNCPVEKATTNWEKVEIYQGNLLISVRDPNTGKKNKAHVTCQRGPNCTVMIDGLEYGAMGSCSN